MVENGAEWEKTYAYGAHLGWKLAQWRNDFAQVEMPLSDIHQNRHGAPHGGVHASLLDTAMGYAGCWSRDPKSPLLCLTLSLNVQYLSRSEGGLFIATGKRTGGGKRTFFAEGQVEDENGVLIAKGTGVFRYRG